MALKGYKEYANNRQSAVNLDCTSSCTGYLNKEVRQVTRQEASEEAISYT